MNKVLLLEKIKTATLDDTPMEEFDGLLAQLGEAIQEERAAETPEQRVVRKAEWKAFLTQHTNRS